MPDKVFIDSNIFIYAKVEQSGENKYQIAKEFLKVSKALTFI